MIVLSDTMQANQSNDLKESVMSKLREYTQLKSRMQEMARELELIEENEAFQNDLKFLTELEELVELYGKSKAEAAELLNPRPVVANKEAFEPRKPRKPRKAKLYRNPHTGEEVLTAGGNHTILKKWRSENPDVELADWVVES